jgi:XisI protein
MDSLANNVREVVFSYATGGLNLRSFPMVNEEHQVYAVLVVDYPVHRYPAGIVVMARIEDDQVFIEEDRTDRPLLDALVQAGVPREKIVLAYAGEAVPSE